MGDVATGGQARVITATDPLNLRSSAPSGSVVGTLPKGSLVTVTGNLVSGFYPVTTTSGQKGYASAQYLEAYIAPASNVPVQPAAAAAAAAADANLPQFKIGDNARVNTATDPLNLRTSAPSGAVKGSLPKGSLVTIVGGLSNGFYQVHSATAGDGWASAQYLKYEAPAAPIPTPIEPVLRGIDPSLTPAAVVSTVGKAVAAIQSAGFTPGSVVRINTATDPLNFRAAGTSNPATAPIIGQLPKGSTATVIQDVGNGFYQLYSSLVAPPGIGVASAQFLVAIGAPSAMGQPAVPIPPTAHDGTPAVPASPPGAPPPPPPPPLPVVKPAPAPVAAQVPATGQSTRHGNGLFWGLLGAIGIGGAAYAYNRHHKK